MNMIDNIPIGMSKTETFEGHEMSSTCLPLESKKRTKPIFGIINGTVEKRWSQANEPIEKEGSGVPGWLRELSVCLWLRL